MDHTTLLIHMQTCHFKPIRFYKHHKCDGYILDQITIHILTFGCILSGVKSSFVIWLKHYISGKKTPP